MGGGYLFRFDGGEVGANDVGAGFLGEIDQGAVRFFHAVGVEGGEAHCGFEALHRVEGAVVERLQDDARGEAVGTDDVADHFAEALGGRGLFRLRRGDFGFDVEFDFAVFGFDEVEYLLQRGDAGAGDGLLFGEAGVGLGAAVPEAELGDGHLADEGFGVGGTLAVGGVHVRVMGDDQDVVRGDGEVELEDVDALFHGVGEGGEGVFGSERAGAAVAVDLNAGSGVGKGHESKENGQYNRVSHH